MERRLELLESLLAELAGEQDEQRIVESIARLARRYLTAPCWIYAGDRGKLRRVAGPQRMPADLPHRVSELARARGARVRRTEACPMVPMLDGGELVGAIAFQPRRAAGPSEWWTARALAAHGGLALGRARSRAGLQHAVQLRDDAFAAAAHEMGNSLAALSLLLNAILQTIALRGAGPASMARLERMEREVDRLRSLSTRMFDSARITAGIPVLAFEQVDLAEVVRETLAHESDQLAWRHCKVRFTSPRRVTGRWDRGFLEQIVGNLLSNAMKYGHGRLISIALSAGAAKARLRVRDRGIGIAPADQARIFEKFERAATVEEGSSLGLGLWLVRQMVGALGGSIRVQSAKGAGSTFEVELPRGAPARSLRERVQ
jgi:signal transduction histidine kinase